MLPGGEILLVDYRNSRLKKLGSAYNVISVCDLRGGPRGVCYIGNNIAVVTVEYQLVYVDVSSMTVRNTVTTDHWCYSITCHNDKLYVMSGGTVYMYTQDGNNRSTLYKLQNSLFYITGIAVSGDGNRIYITDMNSDLITIDTFGNFLNSLTFPDARAVCVDDRGNVWVGGMFNKKLYQVSADGARLLGTVSVDELNDTQALCYDRDRSSLIVAGSKDNIHVVQLD
jgi:DNA-binding beta-propeller fold protein YncE